MKQRVLAIGVICLLLLGGQDVFAQDITGQVSWNFTGHVAEGGTWDMRVTASGRDFVPGDGLTLAVEFVINSYGLAYNINNIDGIYTLVTGMRTFTDDGMMIGGSQNMASTAMSGVGLPIEIGLHGLPTDRFGGTFHHPIDSFLTTPVSELNVDADTGIITGTAVHGIMLSEDIPPGWYNLRLDLGLEISPGDVFTLWGEDPGNPDTTEDKQTFGITGPIAIGTTSQPQMLWTLFSSSIPSGGVIALENIDSVAATRNLGYSDVAVLPMNTPLGGQIRYLLEPDFPLVWNPFMRTNGRLLDLDFHSGWMEVRIENPGGSIVDLGGAPFNGRRGLGATTLQDRFAYSFSSYGRHRIELTGWIKDTTNQTYVGGGVYEIYIAKPLDIETNVLPGTPLGINDLLDPGFQLYPPVPANVEVTWELDEYSQMEPSRGSFSVRANRWGYYTPPILSGRDRFARVTQVQFNSPGEYKVCFRATYTEDDGTLWMGEKVLSGVVIPENPIELASRPPVTGSFAVTSDARYVPVPADTGDTVILPVTSPTGLPSVFTFPVGFFPGDQAGFRTDDSALVEFESGSAGTFVMPRFASSSGLFPYAYPDDIDRRGYLMSFASRSDEYFQARLSEGSSFVHLPYPDFPWLAGELAPDTSGDIYHFWTYLVYRDITANSTRYGFYSSGIALSDSVSVPGLYSPGTALVNDGWGPRNVILHNLAVRPGSVVSEGEPFSPCAYFLPLPPESSIEYILTPPEGDQRIFTISANQSGYANGMRERITLDQQGIWLAEVTLTQEDVSGGILGVNPGEPWEFYVINGGNNIPITFHLPFMMPVNPDDNLLVLTGDLLDSDIVEGTVHISATFNGGAIEQTERQIQNGAFVYSIDLHQIGNSFKNYDPDDSRDRIVLTFYVVGLTSGGNRRVAAKTVYVIDGMLYTGEKQYSPIDPMSHGDRMQELADMAESELARELRGRGEVNEQTE